MVAKQRSFLTGLMICTALAGSLVLNGCVPGGNLSLSANPDDPCSTERVALGDSENFFARNILGHAAVGALIGAGLGAIFAKQQNKGVGKAALFGAGAGALSGGISGYLKAKKKQANDTRELAQLIHNDIETEAHEINQATVAFVRLRRCRLAAAKQIRADFKAGLISRNAAQNELTEMKTSFAEEINIARQLGVKMKKRASEFKAASLELLAENDQAEQRFESWVQDHGADMSATRYFVTTTASKVRKGAGIGYPVTHTLPGHAPVMVDVGQTYGNWRAVILEDGQRGFVYKSLLSDDTTLIDSAMVSNETATEKQTGVETISLDDVAQTGSLAEDEKDALRVAIATESSIHKRVNSYNTEIASAENDLDSGAFSLNMDEASERLVRPCVFVCTQTI